MKNDGRVVAQRESTSDQIEFHEQKVWRVPSTCRVIFSETSDCVQPYGFNLISNLESLVDFYSGDDIPVSGDLPDGILPFASVKASELSGRNLDRIISGTNFWVAYIGRDWVGCSEY